MMTVNPCTPRLWKYTRPPMSAYSSHLDTYKFLTPKISTNIREKQKFEAVTKSCLATWNQSVFTLKQEITTSKQQTITIKFWMYLIPFHGNGITPSVRSMFQTWKHVVMCMQYCFYQCYNFNRIVTNILKTHLWWKSEELIISLIALEANVYTFRNFFPKKPFPSAGWSQYHHHDVTSRATELFAVE